jgi:hypothetical protein
MTCSYSEKVRALTVEINELKSAVTELKSLTEEGKDTGAALKKALDKDRQIKRLLDSIKI